MEEEAAEEAVAVRNDAMTIFTGHSGKEVQKYKYVCISLFYHSFHPPFSFFHLTLLFFCFFPVSFLPLPPSVPQPQCSLSPSTPAMVWSAVVERMTERSYGDPATLQFSWSAMVSPLIEFKFFHHNSTQSF